MLSRALSSPRFRKVEQVAKLWVHHFDIREPCELDAQVRGWLAEYAMMGDQRRLD